MEYTGSANKNKNTRDNTEITYYQSSFGGRESVGLKKGKFDYVSSTSTNAKRIGATVGWVNVHYLESDLAGVRAYLYREIDLSPNLSTSAVEGPNHH